MSWDFDYFSGTPYLGAGDVTDLDGKTALSVHAWTKLSTHDSDHSIIAKYDGSSGLVLFFETSGVNGKVDIPKWMITIDSVTCRAEGPTDNLFTTGVWHPVGGSWIINDAAGIKLYFDGSLSASGSTTGHAGKSFPNLTTGLNVGRRWSPSVSWDGAIGEIAIWSEVLSADEFAALASGTPAYQIRPGALLFWSQMQSGSSPEWYVLPASAVSAAFDHDASVTWVADDPPAGLGTWIEEELAHGAVSTSSSGTKDLTSGSKLGLGSTSIGLDSGTALSSGGYSEWALVQTRVSSDWIDTAVVNGTTYQYKLKAIDTSNNASDFCTAQSATPTAGTAGPPLVPEYPRRRRILVHKRRTR